MKSPRIWNLFARRSQLRNPILRHKTELPTSAKQKKQTAPLLFLHVRKAGGTSLLHFLINQFPADSILDQASIEARQRDNLSRYRFVAGHVSASIVANFDQAPQLITCIRDPIERILSEFAYCRSHGPVEIAALPNYDWSPDEIKGFRGVCEKMRAGDLRSFLDREPILAQSWFGNMMTRQLVGLPLFSPVEPTLEDLELACRTLRRCAHFSLTHKMYESFWLLTRRFGWAMPESVPHANVSRKRLATADLDETTLARLRMLTRIDSQLFEYAQQLFNERLQEAGFSEGAERQDVDVSLLEEPHDFCFDQPIRGSGWHARERDQHGWFAWSGPDCDAWLDLSRPPSSNRRLLCSVRHAASSEILNATRLTINGHHVKHKFKANGPEVILIADFNKSHLQANQERVRIGISVPATITPDSGFVEERRLGVAVSRIAFVRR